jgi:hypothetical protein
MHCFTLHYQLTTDISGLIVGDYTQEYSHWNAVQSLGEWLQSEGVPALSGIDTRSLTRVLRERGKDFDSLRVFYYWISSELVLFSFTNDRFNFLHAHNLLSV